jgi:hypothetical protein
MIQALIRFPLLAVIGLGLSWTLTAAFRSKPPLPEEATTDFQTAFPHADARSKLRSLALHSTQEIRRQAEETFGTAGLNAGPYLTVTWIRSRMLLSILPAFLALLVAGVLGGIALRERIRHGRGYASPTAAHLARHLFTAGLLFLILFALSPVPAPAWSLYLAAISCSLGILGYAANLPISL